MKDFQSSPRFSQLEATLGELVAEVKPNPSGRVSIGQGAVQEAHVSGEALRPASHIPSKLVGNWIAQDKMPPRLLSSHSR